MRRKKLNKSNIIPITCKGQFYVPIQSLYQFQGNLKGLPPENFEKLKKSIQKYGFSFPVFTWQNNIIDGHQRVYATQKLIDEGYTIDDIPCVEILAKDKKEAAEKLLVLNSQYAKMTNEGISDFVSNFDIDEKEMSELLDFNIKKMVKEVEKSFENETIDEVFGIYIQCDDEDQQKELLERFIEEGLECKALVS